MEEWKKYKMSDFIDFNPTVSLKKGTVARKITMDKLIPHSRDIYDWEYEPYSGGSKFQNGDTIMARITPCLENGKHAFISLLNDGETAYGSTEYIVMRGIPGISDNRFVYYLSHFPDFKNAAVKSMVGSSGRQRAQVDVLKNLEFYLPGLKEQRKIADTLSTLDDKIALNNRINHNLEEQAQALYRSWFVDFEPFKDGRFVESELGFIPEGWRVGSIYDICEIYYGAPFNSTLFNTEKKGLPLIRIRDLAKQEAGVFTEERHIKGQLTHKGDVLVGMDGEFSIYIWGGVDSWINQRISRFTPKPGISHYFLTETLRPQLKAVESSEVATTVIHIGKNDYDKFLAIIPPQRVMDSFYHVSEPLFLQYVENLSSNHSLSESRDILLPRLMSGQLTC